MATDLSDRTVTAPDVLGLTSRHDFRAEAYELLEGMPEGSGRLVVDLSRTTRVDSAGLGALMLVQRRASDHGHVVVLRGASDEIRFLLALTRLSEMFEFERAG